MNAKYERLYQDLQNDIEECSKKSAEKLAEIECCFQMSNACWDRVRKEVLLSGFCSMDEEIDFFKTKKPAFISEIEYFSLCYYCQIFRPSGSANDLKNFLIREMNKLQVFIEENLVFYEYYITGSRIYDARYFVRSVPDTDNLLRIKSSHPDDAEKPGYDYLIASFIALKKYKQYAAKELEACMENL